MSKKATFPVMVDFHKTNGADTGFTTEGPSLTRQEFAEDCDINALMKRYDGYVIGGPGNMAPQTAMYADFAEAPQTLLEYLEYMKMAEATFMSLPAVVRKEFENDPVQFVEFASDPENLPQMRTWGLAPPEKPQEPPPAVKAPSPPADSQAPSGASTHDAT